MKLAISMQEAGAGALVDLRFGRARFFRIVGTETGEQTVLDNAAGIHAAQGAGTQAAQKLAREGVRACPQRSCRTKGLERASGGGDRRALR